MTNVTPTFLVFWVLLLLGTAPACGPSGDDDDTADDDDAADDDDSAASDDDDSAASGDDDDSTPSGSCDDPALAAALQTLGGWSRQISCGHFFSTATAADSFRLGAGFIVPNVPAPVVGTTWTQTFGGGMAVDEVSGNFEIQTGNTLTYYDCNDALEVGVEPVVVQQWTPILGSATMEVTALGQEQWSGGPWTFTGSVSVSNVVVELEGSSGTTCSIPDTVFVGLGLGWLPG